MKLKAKHQEGGTEDNMASLGKLSLRQKGQKCKLKKKSPATEENEALNNERADLELLPLATEKCTITTADPVIESRSYRRS